MLAALTLQASLALASLGRAGGFPPRTPHARFAHTASVVGARFARARRGVPTPDPPMLAPLTLQASLARCKRRWRSLRSGAPGGSHPGPPMLASLTLQASLALASLGRAGGFPPRTPPCSLRSHCKRRWRAASVVGARFARARRGVPTPDPPCSLRSHCKRRWRSLRSGAPGGSHPGPPHARSAHTASVVGALQASLALASLGRAGGFPPRTPHA